MRRLQSEVPAPSFSRVYEFLGVWQQRHCRVGKRPVQSHSSCQPLSSFVPVGGSTGQPEPSWRPGPPALQGDGALCRIITREQRPCLRPWARRPLPCCQCHQSVPAHRRGRECYCAHFVEESTGSLEARGQRRQGRRGEARAEIPLPRPVLQRNNYEE